MLNLYIIHDNFKKNDSKMFRILLWETDWLTSYFRMTRLCYPHSFENVYKTLINIAETCFLPAKRASNIITLTAKVLSPNFWYKKVPTKFMFLKIIHKSEASYQCCYQKSYTELIGRSFSTQYLCSRFFNGRDYNGKFQDWAKQNKVKSLTTSNYNR